MEKTASVLHGVQLSQEKLQEIIDKAKEWALLHGKCQIIFYCRLLLFFKINFFEKLFQDYHLSVKQIGSR